MEGGVVKVYVVSEGAYSDHHVERVFQSEADADRYVLTRADEDWNSYYEILECEVHPEGTEIKRRTLYSVHANHNDSGIRTLTHLLDEDDPAFEDDRLGVAQIYTGSDQSIPSYWTVNGSGIDEQALIESASNLIAQHKAQEQKPGLFRQREKS
jgi:hypothetical protein